MAEVCGKRELATILPFKRHTFKFRVLTINFSGACSPVNLPFPKISIESFGPYIVELPSF